MTMRISDASKQAKIDAGSPKIWKVVFEYAESKYSNTKNKVGATYILAATEKEAKANFGYGSVIAVIEVTPESVVAS